MDQGKKRNGTFWMVALVTILAVGCGDEAKENDKNDLMDKLSGMGGSFNPGQAPASGNIRASIEAAREDVGAAVRSFKDMAELECHTGGSAKGCKDAVKLALGKAGDAARGHEYKEEKQGGSQPAGGIPQPVKLDALASSSGSSGGGSPAASGGSVGTASTPPTEAADPASFKDSPPTPVAQLGNGATDTQGGSYRSGGGRGPTRKAGGPTGGSGGLGSLLGGGAGGGFAGSAPGGGSLDFAEGGSAGRNLASLLGQHPQDPSDYFERIDIYSNLFKTIERKYREKQMNWALEDAHAYQN